MDKGSIKSAMLETYNFTLHGQKCELVRRFLPSVGHYFCGYVLLDKPLTQEQYDLITISFMPEITYRSNKKIGFDTGHSYEVESGKSDDFEYAKIELLENLALVVNEVLTASLEE